MDPQARAPAVPAPPSHIKPTSYFSPRSRQCCQCDTRSPTPSQSQTTAPPSQQICPCDHQLCRDCPRQDTSGSNVIPHSFPVDWVCSTCNAVHSVLEILTMNVACVCEKPTLQAVYDQFGRIFLYWRDDPAVYDLMNGAKLQEAAWRVWEAGSEPWLPVVVEVEKQITAEVKSLQGKLGQGLKWNRFSQSSISSRDSLDIEMAEAA